MDSFSNQGINIHDLPKAEDITLLPIEPSYWKVLKWSWTIVSIILMAALTIILLVAYPANLVVLSLIPTLAIFLLLIFWLMRKSFLWKAYAVREKDIIYRTGWLIRKVSICPFNRIQHCSINAGPFERKLGLSSLSIYTAGSEGADFKIPGLKEETALSLRDFILAKTTIDERADN